MKNFLGILLCLLFLTTDVFSDPLGDIRVRIPEASINTILNALIKGRALNLGSYTGSGVLNNWYFNIDSASIDCSPGGHVTVKAYGSAKANLDFYFFSSDIDESAYLSFTANFSVRSNSDGSSSLMMKLSNPVVLAGSSNTFAATFSVLFDAVSISTMPYIVYAFPEFEVDLGTNFLPNSVGYVSKEVPILTTTDTDIILGFNVDLPNNVSVLNQTISDNRQFSASSNLVVSGTTTTANSQVNLSAGSEIRILPDTRFLRNSQVNIGITQH